MERIPSRLRSWTMLEKEIFAEHEEKSGLTREARFLTGPRESWIC